ncbi:MAG TPA: FAD-binding protein, partial [Thermoplasmatales archaeon]|nr:FAD-binding protein [Thermoplasmatales archaeon]
MFDVLIIGAGPAGGMAAKTIASSGYSVAIIEIKKE